MPYEAARIDSWSSAVILLASAVAVPACGSAPAPPKTSARSTSRSTIRRSIRTSSTSHPARPCASSSRTPIRSTTSSSSANEQVQAVHEAGNRGTSRAEARRDVGPGTARRGSRRTPSRPAMARRSSDAICLATTPTACGARAIRDRLTAGRLASAEKYAVRSGVARSRRAAATRWRSSICSRVLADCGIGWRCEERQRPRPRPRAGTGTARRRPCGS